MFRFAGLYRFWAIFGMPGGPSNRICYQKLVDENEHNSHGHFLMFDMYGLNFPYKALAICVHLFSSIFWECFRNHMFRWSILDQNAEKCGWRCDWLFWRSMNKTVKSCKTGILRINFRWLYINVETQTALKMQKNLDRSDFFLTGSSQTAVFKNRQK